MSGTMVFLLVVVFFFVGYIINMFAVTVLYHRGLAHQSVKLNPKTIWFVEHFGVWMTGIDPLAWACMHRLHHRYSDTEKDPHSPLHFGVFGVLIAQMKSYEMILGKLKDGDSFYKSVVQDIPFGVNKLSLGGLWLLPYFVLAAICLALGFWISVPLAGVALYLGLMTHPIQGWMVNSFAHKFGYVSYETGDNSKNNRLVALLVFGEGLQNNHHAFPNAANFALTAGEHDPGYALCRAGHSLGWLQIPDSRP